MSRRNEIKKDIWKIMQDVYRFSDHVEITDKQNDFLDKVVQYLEANISLRRKTDKSKEEIDETPLERPVASSRPEFSLREYKRKRRGESEESVERAGTQSLRELDLGTGHAPAVAKPAQKPTININALPEHLRKYVKS